MAGKNQSAVVCARLSQQYATSSSALARTIPGFSTTQVITSSPHLGSGIPKTGLVGEKDRSIVSDDVPISILGMRRRRLRWSTVRALRLRLRTLESRIQNDDVANLTDAISRQHKLQVECQLCLWSVRGVEALILLRLADFVAGCPITDPQVGMTAG